MTVKFIISISHAFKLKIKFLLSDLTHNKPQKPRNF